MRATPAHDLGARRTVGAVRKTSGAGDLALCHLHSCHSVAWSMRPGPDSDDVLALLTPYAKMKLRRVELLPFHPTGKMAGDRE